MEVTKYLFKFILYLLIVTLYACSSSDDAPTISSKATTEIPSDLQKLTLAGGGTLAAYVTINGDTASRIEMTIDGTGNGSASASIPGLRRESYTIVISYEFTFDDTNDTIVLASASSMVDLSSGSDSMSFSAVDYDLDSYDTDGDGISNAAELAAGTDPRDGSCVIGESIIGSCSLG